MDNRIGAVVARERKALGLTQEELARRLGVTKAAVSKWELGQSMPDTALLPSIAAQFALSIDELFDWRAHLTDAEIETCAQTAREKLAADASQGATYVRMRAREHRSCWKLLVRLASELLSAANHVAFGICQDAPDDERAQERARETMCALAGDAHSLCEPVLDGCSDAELMADATRVCAASSVLTGKPTEAIAWLTPLYQAQTHRVGTELASAQLAAGEQEEAAATLAACVTASALELTSLAGTLLTRAASATEVAAYVHAMEAIDRAFDLSHRSAPTLPAMHIAAATIMNTLGDDAAALELLERAAGEVCALGNGRIPENPLGNRVASNMLPAITDDEALAHMRESASYARYPEAARHMILDARLWGALAQSPEYAALAKRLDAE